MCDLYRCDCTKIAYHGEMCQMGKHSLTTIADTSTIFICQNTNSFILDMEQWKLITFISCLSFFKSAGDPWMGPELWNTMKPSLHLNLDDETPFILHGGIMMVVTPVRWIFPSSYSFYRCINKTAFIKYGMLCHSVTHPNTSNGIYMSLRSEAECCRRSWVP